MSETRRTTTPAAEEILGGYFPVLDYGFVSLVDYMGGDESIEQAARVSYGHGTRSTSKTEGLIRYLRRHRHTTPTEMVEMKFHVAMPIFVARQWVRHRTASLNEYSGRYSLMPMAFFTPEEWRIQSKANNQGSADTSLTDFDSAIVHAKITENREYAVDLYQHLNEWEVARELARIDLPLSTYTQWYWKIDLHNLFHFLSLRCDSHAQWEIRAYANVIAGMVKRVAPLSFQAWLDYDFYGEKMSLGEMQVIQRFLLFYEDAVFGNQLGAIGIDEEKLQSDYGMSKREIREFREKINGEKQYVNFDLDLADMKEPEYFQNKLEAMVPT